MKRILIVIGNFFNAGLERRTVNLANHFAQKGHLVDILVIGNAAEKSFFQLHKNVTVHTPNAKKPLPNSLEEMQKSSNETPSSKSASPEATKADRTSRSPKKGIIHRIKSTYSVKKLRYYHYYHPFFKQIRPDIVIVFSQEKMIYAYYGGFGLDYKFFVSEMNAHETYFPNDPRKRSLHLKLFRKAEKVIVQTEHEREFYQQYLNNVVVINNPILAELPAPYTGEREKTIVNFCRISPQKNLLLLIDAFDRFRHRFSDYQLHIYGTAVFREEFRYVELVRKKIAELGLEDHVSILPPRQDIHNVILRSAMFVSSSDYEGLSNSMLEAMAIGLPCVCTDCDGGGTREVMVDHENGLIVPKKDADALYRAMKEFAENPTLAEKCGRNATKIKDRLSNDRIIKQWFDVIDPDSV